MFASVVQPPILSLFSSTSTDCLALFSTHTDADLPADSFVHLLDDATSRPAPPAPQTLLAPHDAGHALAARVLHIQSPTLPRAYIRCPPWHAGDLGVALAWLHLQVRNLGRAWSVEVGVVDTAGRAGRVRCSTFQKQARLRVRRGSALLHVPLQLPADASRPLTAWCTVSLHLPALLPHFVALSSQTDKAQVPLPSGRFSHVSYVKVYASCRLRRIWFTAEKRDVATEPWEFGLYSQ